MRIAFRVTLFLDTPKLVESFIISIIEKVATPAMFPLSQLWDRYPKSAKSIPLWIRSLTRVFRFFKGTPCATKK